MLLAICAALAVGALLYTFWVKPGPVVGLSPVEREAVFLNERKEVIYENLRDLQLEYRMGKLSEKDYQQLKEHYQEQLAGLLHAWEQLPAAATSAARPGPGSCPQCGFENPPGHRFCGACGTQLAPPGVPSA